MNSQIRHAAEHWARRVTPSFTLFLAALVSLISIPVEGYTFVAPSLSLIAVYCWSVWRLDLLPYAATFIVGLCEDAIRGTPLGATAALLIVAQGFARSQQRYLFGRSFGLFWLAFAAIAVFVATAQWVLMSVWSSRLLAVEAGLIQMLLTIALFPAVAWLLLAADRRLVADR